jgi:hypothetical protein
MELALKEHRSGVSAIAVTEPLVASCSLDGSCVVSKKGKGHKRKGSRKAKKKRGTKNEKKCVRWN